MTTESDNFLDLEASLSSYTKSRFAVLPIPYDATTTFLSETRFGPAAIINASQQVELYDHELGGEFTDPGVATLDPLEPNASSPEAMHQNIYETARQIIEDGKFLLSLGGEHSITSGLVRAAKSKYPKLSVLQIDAHADLRDSYEGSKYSHACVMRRIHDMGLPFTGVGIRSYSAEEAHFMKQAKISPITALECHTSEDWQQRALEGLTDQVYVTIDIDGFDPAYAPGTGTPEPGGLDWYQATDLLRAVASKKVIVAADIVEVIPIPGQAASEFLAAKLAYKIICYLQAAEQQHPKKP